MTRRRFVLSSLAAGTAAASWPCFWEPRWLELTRHTAKLAPGRIANPVRVLHLADLHASMFVPQSLIDRAISMGLAEKPDLICVTGDFITHREDFSSAEYARTLSRLSAAAPTFAVLGNHDGGIWARAAGGHADHAAVERLLEHSGIQLLHNRSARVPVRGAELSLVGLGDLWSDEIEAKRQRQRSATASGSFRASKSRSRGAGTRFTSWGWASMPGSSRSPPASRPCARAVRGGQSASPRSSTSCCRSA